LAGAAARAPAGLKPPRSMARNKRALLPEERSPLGRYI